MSVKYTELVTKDVYTVNSFYSEKGVFPALAPVAFADCPDKMQKAGYARGDGRFLELADNKLYSSRDGRAHAWICDMPAIRPDFLETQMGETSYSVMIGDSQIAFIYGNNFGSDSRVSNLYCATVHAGRLFGADLTVRNKLRWTGELGPHDFHTGIYDGGWILLDPARGDIFDMRNLGGRIAAVREFGITEITAGGLPENIKISYTGADCPKTYPRTAQVVCGRLYFATEEGVYSYAGGALRAENGRYMRDILSPTDSVALGNFYFLCGESKLLGRKAVMCHNALSGESTLIDLPASALAANDVVYAYSGAKMYKLTGEEEMTFFASADFGNKNKKCLTAVYVSSEQPVDVTVSNGDIRRVITGVQGRRKLVMNGRKFDFTFKSAGAVYSVTAQAEDSEWL